MYTKATRSSLSW